MDEQALQKECETFLDNILEPKGCVAMAQRHYEKLLAFAKAQRADELREVDRVARMPEILDRIGGSTGNAYGTALNIARWCQARARELEGMK